MQAVKKFFRWLLSLPFALLWLIFGLAGAFSPLLRIFAVLLTLFMMCIGWFRTLLDSKSYGLFATYVGILLAMFFSKQLFGFLADLSEKIEFKILYNTPIFRRSDYHPDITETNTGDQKITLTMDQLRELMNKDR